MHRVAFSVDDIDEALEVAARHGCLPLRGVATYEDLYKLTYVRGPAASWGGSFAVLPDRGEDGEWSSRVAACSGVVRSWLR